MIKNKYFLFCSLVAVSLFCFVGFVLATEVTYPSIPGLVAPNDCKTNCLPTFVSYWFGLLIYLASAISLISFAIGGIGMIISGDNATAASDAKDRMKGAVLGLVLTMFSFFILRTINESLVSPSLTPLPGVMGVFYTNGTERAPVGLMVDNVANRPKELIENSFNSITYDCIEGQETIAPMLLIWEFPKPGFQGNDNNYSGVVVKRLACGAKENIGSLGSFKMAFETPGVYYCLGGCSGDMCAGLMSGVQNVSQNQIGEPFAGKIKGVRIVSYPSDDANYGAIFHKVMGLENGGHCNLPITNSGTTPVCKPVSDTASTFAVDIFRVGKDYQASGNGVTFFSEANGELTENKAGSFEVKKSQVNPYQQLDPSTMCFDYTNKNATLTYKYKCTDSKCGTAFGESGNGKKCEKHETCASDEFCDPITETCSKGSGTACDTPEDCLPGEECGQAFLCVAKGKEGVNCSAGACESLQDCPGAIQISGNYLVAVYSQDPQNKDSLFCHTFTNNVDKLGNTQYLPSAGSKTDFDKVYIIPRK